jgi:glycerate kinase
MGGRLDASFALLGPDHRTAALDMASAAGLLHVAESSRNPMNATTYGVGELICAALGVSGVERLVIGLGGSATNDCGAGCLQALGFRLLDADGRNLGAPLLPSEFERIAKIDASGAVERLARANVVIACDVDNPLTGPNGASHVFGPQKGATPVMVDRLDALLGQFGRVLDEWSICRGGKPISERPGAGAAGGLGAALMAAFPQATVTPGIDVVLDISGFAEAAEDADLVLTGEGKLDSQTLGGKAIDGVLRRAAELCVPVIAIVGSAEAGAVAELRRRGLTDVFELVEVAGSLESALRDSAKYVAEAATRAISPIVNLQ